jgi:hypothetical protein
MAKTKITSPALEYVHRLRKENLRELGWKALVAELGVVNATRFVMELHEGKQDYSKLRGIDLVLDVVSTLRTATVLLATCVAR